MPRTPLTLRIQSRHQLPGPALCGENGGPWLRQAQAVNFGSLAEALHTREITKHLHGIPWNTGWDLPCADVEWRGCGADRMKHLVFDVRK